jgi:uncharacterized protein
MILMLLKIILGKIMENRKKPSLVLWAIVLLSLFGIIFFAVRMASEKSDGDIDEVHRIEEPQFVKEGELAFINAHTSDTLKTIDIEIADDEESRTQGLMHRRSMRENRGMLFIFDHEDRLSFWMKNTHLSLDIMYVNEKMKIVDIHYNAVPFSERSLPSKRMARYVVEVNAGFAERHGITEGDFISFKRI